MRESKHFWTNYLTKFWIVLNGIWYTIEMCWCDENRYPCTLHFGFNLIDFDLDLSSQESEKANISEPIISQGFELNLVNYWDVLVWWTSCSFSCLFAVQRRKPYIYDFGLRKKSDVGLYSDIYRPISLWLSVGLPWPSFKVLLYKKLQTLVSTFSLMWLPVCMKFSMLLLPAGLLKLMLTLFCASNIQGRELC